MIISRANILQTWLTGIVAVVVGFSTASTGVADPASKPSDETPVVVIKGLKRTKPTDEPPPLALYAKVPKVEQISLSPDGSQVAFVSREGQQRFLGTFRFSDQIHSIFKLENGNVSSIAWIDDAHVLLSDTRKGLRGTCFAVDKGADQVPDKWDAAPNANLTEPGSALQQSIINSLLSSINPPGCVFYGVRAQNAITSLNITTGKAVGIGSKFSEVSNLALGVPQVVVTGGKTGLLGPFMEMRAKSVGSQPAQRVYLWQADPDTGHGELVEDHGGDIEREHHYIDDWIVDHDGQIVARSAYDFISSKFTIETKQNGAWHPVLTRMIVAGDHTFAPFLIGLGQDGKSIVILDTATHGSDSKNGRREFHYYQLSNQGQFSSQLEAGDAADERPIFDPRSGRLAGFAHEAPEESYEIFDPDLRAIYVRAQNAAPGEAVRVLTVSNDLKHVLIYAQGTEDTGSYYVLDFSTNTSFVVGENYSDIPTNWIADQKAFTYNANDGLEINGFLTIPPKQIGTPLPLIVLPHDGPPGYTGRDFDWLAQALASRGYLVFQPNYRGSDGYGPQFAGVGTGAWDSKIPGDLNDGVAALVKQGLADPGKVCIVGIGYGGYLALKSAPLGSYRCAASINGISDVKKYFEWKVSQRSQPDADEFASLTPSKDWPRAFVKESASLRELSVYLGSSDPQPIEADSIKTPLIVIHSHDDPLVPDEQSTKFVALLKSAGKVVTDVELPGADHALGSDSARLSTLNALLPFLESSNPAGQP